MSASLKSWGARLAQVARVVALLLFVLPWTTVSCAGQPIASLSGAELASGHFTLTNPMTGAPESVSNGGDVFVIVAAILILTALVASSFVKNRKGVRIAIGASCLAGCSLVAAVFATIPGSARASLASHSAGAGLDVEQVARLIQVKVLTGFWLTLLALAVAVMLDVVAMKGAPPGATPSEV